MTEAHAVLVLMRWKALQFVRANYRRAGVKYTQVPMSQQKEAAEAYLREHLVELIEWAHLMLARINIAQLRLR